jgi:hypothetical protein
MGLFDMLLTIDVFILQFIRLQNLGLFLEASSSSGR